MHAFQLDPVGLWAVKIDIKSWIDEMVIGELSSFVFAYTQGYPQTSQTYTRISLHCKLWLQESRFIMVSLERKCPDPVIEQFN